ncbi:MULTISPECIES: hypothetical protein [unclassified Pseudonocardia]|uniref:hypothetical protein n=1 Tax=unclassified Pseudonocardia TaxID=2619320 RepID=UPI00094AA925|nr:MULTISPECIES: hypothetical protein [unclassified Pseudonocardia]
MSQPKVGSAALLLALGVVGSLVAGCQKPLEDVEWCAITQADLTAHGVGWPVANQVLTPIQLHSIPSMMEGGALNLKNGDLKVAVEAWVVSYKAVLPYLAVDDPKGFDVQVDEGIKRQLHYANTAITNICQW